MMSGTAQNENGTRSHPNLTGKFWVSCWRPVLCHEAVLGNASSHTGVLAAGGWSNYQLRGGAREKESKKREKIQRRRRKSIPPQDFKSQNCWQTLMKLPASLLVRNPTQAGLTSKHNLNGNVFLNISFSMPVTQL